jgi:hypothetical protein
MMDIQVELDSNANIEPNIEWIEVTRKHKMPIIKDICYDQSTSNRR